MIPSDFGTQTRTTGTSPGQGDGADCRHRLYRIMSAQLSPETKRQRLLELGRHRLDLENGHIAAVEEAANRHEIIAASGSDLVQAGNVTSLDQTFCRKTVTMDETLALYDAPAEGWADDPANKQWGIDCYIGNTLLLGGEVYGTLCFVDSEPRAQPFTEAERSFVDLLNASISRLLEQESYEHTLEQARDRFQLFVQEIADYAMFMLDPAGHIVSWNDGARFLKGYTEDEIIGEHFSQFYTDQDRDRALPEELLAKAREMGRVEDEGWRVRKDGSTFWALVSITALFDDEGTLQGFGKVTRDLTDRRRARQELKSQQAFTKRALDTLNDIFFVLTPAGEIERVNQRGLDVTGYSRDEFLSMNAVDFFVEKDQQAVIESVAEALETGESIVEADILTKDNERRRYEFRGKRLTADDGSVTGIVGIGRDITERSLYEERLDVAQRVLRHNLRNGLTVVRGWTEVLGETATDTQQDAVDQILSVTDRLIGTSEKTRQMVELEMPARSDEAAVDVTAQMPAIVEDFQRSHPAATIELELPPVDGLWVPADTWFRTAVINAIENAIEHNPAAEPWVGVVVEQREGQVRIRIHDDGPGIPEVEQEVLERGEETPLEHGSGVGLWLIYWCMTLSGGDVSLEDRDPNGTTVTLVFPPAEGPKP